MNEIFDGSIPSPQEGNLDGFSSLVNACVDKNEGDYCITQTREGETEGICMKTRNNNTACVPQPK